MFQLCSNSPGITWSIGQKRRNSLVGNNRIGKKGHIHQEKESKLLLRKFERKVILVDHPNVQGDFERTQT